MKQHILLPALFAITLPSLAQKNVSFQNELQRSIDRGMMALKASQHEDGWWTSPEHPAVTALVLVAYNGNPSKPKISPAWVKNAYDLFSSKRSPMVACMFPAKVLPTTIPRFA